MDQSKAEFDREEDIQQHIAKYKKTTKNLIQLTIINNELLTTNHRHFYETISTEIL